MGEGGAGRGRRGEAALLASLGVAAGALRWLAWERTAALYNDGPVFLGLAQLFAAGEWQAALAHPYHPLYPLAIAAAHALFPGLGWEDAGALVSVVAGVASVALLYGWLRDAVGRVPAATGAAILAVHPYAVAYSSDVMSDGLYLALFLAGVRFLWKGLRARRARSAAAAGFFAGLAYLTRPEGLGLAVAGVLLAAGEVVRHRVGARAAGALAGALVGATLLVASPYLLELRAESGAWALTRKKALLEFGGFPVERARAPQVVVEPALLASHPFLETVAYGARGGLPPEPAIGDEPARAWRLRAEAAGALLGAFASALRPEILGLVVLGAFARGRGPELSFVLTLGGLYAVVLYALAAGVGYVNRRYALPPAVLTLGYAAAGVPVLGGALLAPLRAAARRPGAAPQGFALAVGLGLVVAVAAPKLAKPRRVDRLAERRAAEWLAAQPGSSGPVAAQKQRVAYYADAPFVRLPQPGALPLVPFLQAAGARYVIVDDRWLDSDPELREAAREGMAVLHRSEAAGGSASVFALGGGSGG
jgi:4-amino-4-deoxy-L-arabinose transferase-like glycosyltransferase